MNKTKLKRIIKEELQTVLKEQESLGADRTIEEVRESLQDSAGQAHKDLQMLAIHLGNARYTTQEVDGAVKDLEGILLMLDQDVKRDVQQIVLRSRRGD